MIDENDSIAAGAGRELREEFAGSILKTIEANRESGADADSMEAEAAMLDALRARATDIHLDPHGDSYRIRFRIDGVMLDVAELDREPALRLVNQFRTFAGLDPTATVQPEVGHFSYTLDTKALDVRVTEAPCVGGDKLAIRLLNPEAALQDIKGLGMSSSQLEEVEKWCQSYGGLLIISGPTGSGKTTTLYALLHQLKLVNSHVVTLEHPVEYTIPGVNQISINEQRGLDFLTGARGMLRLDPDYVVIGELRDRSAANAMMSATAGGCATMCALHARDAVDAVTALRNLGLDDVDIAAKLELVVSQRLLRRLCPQCRTTQAPSRRDREWLESVQYPVPEEKWVPNGCGECEHLGFRGRIGIFEIWRVAPEDFDTILRHGDVHAIRRTLAQRQHGFLLDDALAKAEKGIISLDDLRHLPGPSVPVPRR